MSDPAKELIAMDPSLWYIRCRGMLFVGLMGVILQSEKKDLTAERWHLWSMTKAH